MKARSVLRRLLVALGLCGVFALSTAPAAPGAIVAEWRRLENASICLLKREAESGDARAQYVLSLRHRQGPTGLRNDVDALAWLEKAAAQGLPQARWALGRCLLSGGASTRERAVDLLREAAEQGFAPAQLELATLYRFGEIVPRDRTISAAWMTRAANQGLFFAQWSLSEAYRLGDGVARDERQAYRWQRIALANPEVFEPIQRGLIRQARSLEKALSAEQIDEARREAAAFSAKPELDDDYDVTRSFKKE